MVVAHPFVVDSRIGALINKEESTLMRASLIHWLWTNSQISLFNHQTAVIVKS